MQITYFGVSESILSKDIDKFAFDSQDILSILYTVAYTSQLSQIHNTVPPLCLYIEFPDRVHGLLQPISQAIFQEF